MLLCTITTKLNKNEKAIAIKLISNNSNPEDFLRNYQKAKWILQCAKKKHSLGNNMERMKLEF